MTSPPAEKICSRAGGLGVGLEGVATINHLPDPSREEHVELPGRVPAN